MFPQARTKILQNSQKMASECWKVLLQNIRRMRNLKGNDFLLTIDEDILIIAVETILSGYGTVLEDRFGNKVFVRNTKASISTRHQLFAMNRSDESKQEHTAPCLLIEK